MITIKTDYEFCFDQPDYQIHVADIHNNHNDNTQVILKSLKLNCSAGQDNHSDQAFVQESVEKLQKDKVNCLDLGCAGGQLILDYNKSPSTNICVGIDGSCGVYKQQNWKDDENKKILKHADLTKPFSVLKDKQEVKFDIISCWEVIEHFEQRELDVFFTNVSNHLAKNGLFFGSIALFEDTRDSDGFYQKPTKSLPAHPQYNPTDAQFKLHKTVFDNPEEWDKILVNYFQVLNYDFKIKPRNDSNSYYFMCKHP